MVRFKDIQAYAAEIARRFQPEKIILFGSHAYGVPTEDSDVDLLVVLPHEENPLSKAWQLRRELPDPGFHAHLIVRDPDVLRWRIENEDWFLREITEKGRVLYEADHAGVAG